MSEAVNIAKSDIIPLTKRLKVIVGRGGIHRFAVPLGEQAVTLDPFVTYRSLVIVLPKLVFFNKGHKFIWDFQASHT